MNGALARGHTFFQRATEIIRVGLQMFKNGVAATVARVIGKIFPMAPTLLDAMLEFLDRFRTVTRGRSKESTQGTLIVITQQRTHHKSLTVAQTTEALVIEIVRQTHVPHLVQVHTNAAHVVGF